MSVCLSRKKRSSPLSYWCFISEPWINFFPRENSIHGNQNNEFCCLNQYIWYRLLRLSITDHSFFPVICKWIYILITVRSYSLLQCPFSFFLFHSHLSVLDARKKSHLNCLLDSPKKKLVNNNKIDKYLPRVFYIFQHESIFN